MLKVVLKDTLNVLSVTASYQATRKHRIRSVELVRTHSMDNVCLNGLRAVTRARVHCVVVLLTMVVRLLVMGRGVYESKRCVKIMAAY